MVSAIYANRPPVEVYTEPPPNLLPVSATVPAMPRQIVSTSSPGPEHETPPTVSIELRSRSSSLITAHFSRYLSTPLVPGLPSQVLKMSTCHIRRLLWLRM